VRSRDAWKIEIPAPRGASQYGVVRVWIDKQSAALLRIEGYDLKGQLAKRFEVISAQKIDGQWMLKQMRVERIDPETRKTTGITYLEVLGKK
jgi:negative regulator of sigma E activity